MINKFKIKNYKLKMSAGFTVLESIVAIFVLSLAISGAFAAVRQSLHQSTLSKDEVKAFYLAQDVIEIIRNKRDTNMLAYLNDGTTTWLTHMSADASDHCYFGKVCRIDSTGYGFTFAGLSYCGTAWNTCPNLNMSSVTFLYTHGNTGVVPTNFKREVMFESVNANEVAVIVRITWTKGLLTKEFKVKTHLFNWI